MQGGLNNKEKQLNLCNIFSILIFNEFHLLAWWLLIAENYGMQLLL